MDELEFDIELFEKGDFIFKEDAPAGGAYLIAAGAVEISKIKHGEKVVLAKKRENDIFGEMSIISDEDRSASAQAIELTTCYKLTEQDFEKMIKGKIVAGESAGANVFGEFFFSPHANDIFKGLEILPIKIIPHYKKGYEDVFNNIDKTIKPVYLKEYEFEVFRSK